jgi:hypothetical protein
MALLTRAWTCRGHRSGAGQEPEAARHHREIPPLLGEFVMWISARLVGEKGGRSPEAGVHTDICALMYRTKFYSRQRPD